MLETMSVRLSHASRVYGLGFRACHPRGIYWGNLRVMEKKMETTGII